MLNIVAGRIGKRGRRYTPDRIALLQTMVDEVNQHTKAITARHLFYRLVSRKAIPKTEEAYDRVLIDLLALRRSEDIKWSAIADGTRTKTEWVGYGSLVEAMEEFAQSYRRDIWRTNSWFPEVWSESRGLLSTINEVASPQGVTTLGMGGYNSATLGWETAKDIEDRWDYQNQRTVIFMVGDYDPSGENISAKAEDGIREHMENWGMNPDVLRFDRLALNPTQIKQYNLPSAPPKVKDARAKNWSGTATTELDALDPLVLQAIIKSAIDTIIDPGLLDQIEVAEKSERSIIDSILKAAKG